MSFDKQLCKRIDLQRTRRDEGIYLDTDIDVHNPDALWFQPKYWVPLTLQEAWKSPYIPYIFSWLLLLGLFALMDLPRKKYPRLFQAALFLIPIGHLVILLVASPLFRYAEAGNWGILILALCFRLQRFCAKGWTLSGKILMGCWCGSLISLLVLLLEDDRSFFPSMNWWAPPPVEQSETVTTDGGITFEYFGKKTRTYDPPIPSGRVFLRNLHYIDPEKGLKGGVYAKPQE